MKKVIDGSLYDTDKARKLGEWNNGCFISDFDYVSEDLYRTRSGKFFIHGMGGATSRYGEWKGNTGMSSEKIIPLTLYNAMDWVKNHLDGDEFIYIFGAPEEGSQLKAIWLSNSAVKQLEELQAQSGKSLSKTVESLIISQTIKTS